jgi:hypothetical protein
MANVKSRFCSQVLSAKQIQSLGLPVGSKVLIELITPHLQSFWGGLGKESGYLTITSDGYTLKFDSEDEEITEAYEYLQGRVKEGCCVRFSLPSDKPIWYTWQSKPWCCGKSRDGVKTLFIGSPN